jgi:hypothetical protein
LIIGGDRGGRGERGDEDIARETGDNGIGKEKDE